MILSALCPSPHIDYDCGEAGADQNLRFRCHSPFRGADWIVGCPALRPEPLAPILLRNSVGPVRERVVPIWIGSSNRSDDRTPASNYSLKRFPVVSRGRWLSPWFKGFQRPGEIHSCLLGAGTRSATGRSCGSGLQGADGPIHPLMPERKLITGPKLIDDCSQVRLVFLAQQSGHVLCRPPPDFSNKEATQPVLLGPATV
jgi:hypothetical protein